MDGTPQTRHVAERRAKLPDAKAHAAMAREMFAAGGPSAIRIREKGVAKGKAQTIVYMAHQSLMAEVLKDPARFSLGHYDRALTDMKFFLTDDDALYDERRALLHASIGRDAQSASIRDLNMADVAQQTCESVIDCLLEATSRPGQFDLLREYGFIVPYLVSAKAFGVEGPATPSWLVRGVQTFKFFATGRRLHLSDETQAMQHMLINSMLMLGQAFTNFETRSGILNWLSAKASNALVDQIHSSLAYAKTHPTRTLISDLYQGQAALGMTDGRFKPQATGILFEVVGTMILLVGTGFSRIMDAMQREGLTFKQLAQIMATRGSGTRFIDEALRLFPVTPSLLRIVRHDTEVQGIALKAGEYVCCLTGEGGHDPIAFPEPDILNWNRGGPPRHTDMYMGFGPSDAPHACFGQHWAREILRQMCLQLARFPALRLASGKHGQTKTFMGMPESLRAFYDHPKART